MNASPRFGFGSGKRDDMARKTGVPGPGHYTAASIIGKDGPAKTMAATIDWAPERREQKGKPGPGTYNGDVKFATMRKEASWRIGTETRNDLALEKRKQFQTAPGQYDPLY